jgi:hypothetical protein
VEHPFALFSPADWLQREHDDHAHLLMHLHGSVLFGAESLQALARYDRIAEVVKFESPTAAVQSYVHLEQWRNPVGGHDFTGYPIISGLQKGARLIYNPRPYGYYHRSIMSLLPRASRLLFLGYGWRDAHLNAWIYEMAKVQPELRAAVVTRRSRGEVDAGYTSEYSALCVIGGEAWLRAQRRAHCEQAQTFFEDRRFAIVPHGFILNDGDAGRLVDFMAA